MKKKNKISKSERDTRENKASAKDAAPGNIHENIRPEGKRAPESQQGKSHMDVQIEGDTYDRDLRDDVENNEKGPSGKPSESTGHSQRGTNPHPDNRSK